jgi:hypothetical protein
VYFRSQGFVFCVPFSPPSSLLHPPPSSFFNFTSHRDPSLYWGTWYTIATCRNCTNPLNVCTQVAFEPINSKNINTNVTYIGSYQNSNPDGVNAMAYGNLSPLNLETFNPLYRLDLDLGFQIVSSNFWILTTAESNNEISAIVTMSCELTSTNQQIFFLSRKPYLVSPVTFDTLREQVQRAITNYDSFDIVPVTQAQGWCDYQLVESQSADVFTNCPDDDDDTSKTLLTVDLIFIVLSTCFSFSILTYLLWLRYYAKPVNEMKSVLMTSA